MIKVNEMYKMFPLDGTYSIDYMIREIKFLRQCFGRGIINALTKSIFEIEDSKLIIVQSDKKILLRVRHCFLLDIILMIYVKFIGMQETKKEKICCITNGVADARMILNIIGSRIERS
jgi:hypothetical protein